MRRADLLKRLKTKDQIAECAEPDDKDVLGCGDAVGVDSVPPRDR